MSYPESYIRALNPVTQNLEGARLQSSSSSTLQARMALRERAISADAASNLEISLALLWRELTHGLCRIVDGFFTEERCYLVLASHGAPSPLEGRRLEVLAKVLCGVGQKIIAIELGLAPSTVALNARLGLDYLGVHCRPSRVHPLLMLAAKAGVRHDGTLAASLSSAASETEEFRFIAIQRPDLRLSRVLPPAELAVTRLLVEGLCYEEIARVRRTSTRTIANQITAVFRRMRVSGRSELLSRLFFAAGLERERASQPVLLAATEPPPASTRIAGSVSALRSRSA